VSFPSSPLHSLNLPAVCKRPFRVLKAKSFTAGNSQCGYLDMCFTTKPVERAERDDELEAMFKTKGLEMTCMRSYPSLSLAGPRHATTSSSSRYAVVRIKARGSKLDVLQNARQQLLTYLAFPVCLFPFSLPALRVFFVYLPSDFAQ
jgi:hypothetical protein